MHVCNIMETAHNWKNIPCNYTLPCPIIETIILPHASYNIHYATLNIYTYRYHRCDFLHKAGKTY